MAAHPNKSQLSADIARALRARNKFDSLSSADGSGKWLLMTGVALAILQSPTAHSLSLGELRVQSAIGEPFVAATTVRLAAGERLSNNCISAPTSKNDGIANPAGLKVATIEATGPGEFPLSVRTRLPLYEPMYEIQLQVQCSGSVALRKNYIVMLNLPLATMATPAQAVAQASAPAPQPTLQESAQRPTARPSVDAERALRPSANPIAAGSLYRVRSGDTLSAIAERVADRPEGSLWSVADMLFSANPDAFIRGNPDLLKLGSMLYIPERRTLAIAADAPPAAPAMAAPASPAVTAPPLAAETAGAPPTPVSEVISTPTRAQLTAAVERAAPEPAEIPAPIAQQNEAAAMPEPITQQDEAAEKPAATPLARPLPRATATEVNPIIAVLAGMLLGGLLAVAMLGRSLLGGLLSRRRREAAEPAPEPTASAAAVTEPPVIDTLRLPAEQADPLSYTRAGIDVELTPATDTSVDLDLSGGELPLADDDTTSPHPPRISLHDRDNEFADMLDELAATGEVSALYAEPAEKLSKSSATSTIRDLFATIRSGEAPDTAPTEILPAATEAPTDKMRHMSTDELIAQDLQTLTQKMDITDDGRLSETLTQALDLLEKDYEDELSTSQRLDKDEVAAAFAKQNRKAN